MVVLLEAVGAAGGSEQLGHIAAVSHFHCGNLDGLALVVGYAPELEIRLLDTLLILE